MLALFTQKCRGLDKELLLDSAFVVDEYFAAIFYDTL